MTNVEITESITRETQGLSLEALRDILNYIHFVKSKKSNKVSTNTPERNDLENELLIAGTAKTMSLALITNDPVITESSHVSVRW